MALVCFAVCLADYSEGFISRDLLRWSAFGNVRVDNDGLYSTDHVRLRDTVQGFLGKDGGGGGGGGGE